MAYYSVCTDAEGFGVALDLLQIAAAQPFGGKLDRGQRVLDLVGDAAGDVGPGRLALRRQQLGDVVEGNDEAADLAAVDALGGDADQKGAGAVVALDLDLRLGQPLRPARRVVEQAGHLRRDQGEVGADHRVEI